MLKLIKWLFGPYQYYQVLLVVTDVSYNEICGFEFRIDQNPTPEQMLRVSRVAWKQCGGISTWYTCCDLVHNGRSRDSKVGTIPKVPSHLKEDGVLTKVYPITSINLID
jgi:hypothetical protein